MRTLIFDNNKKYRDKLQDSLRRITQNNALCVDSPEELLSAYAEHRAELVFIRLGDTLRGGLGAAKQLCGIDHQAYIIVVSRSRDYAMLAFEAGASDYILDPVTDLKLHEALSKIEKRETKRQ